MTHTPVVAAFDVDGTLTRRDCVVPFLRRVRGTVPLTGRLLVRVPTVAGALVARDRDRLKQLATAAAFTGVPVEEVESHASAFVEHAVLGWLRSDTVDRLAWHRSEGHEVVLVSASYEVYLVHLARHLSADQVLATRLATLDDVCTGALNGENCRGPEKRRRLHHHLDQRYGGRGAVEVWAYGDSTGDRELLEDADHPVWARHPLSSVVPRV